jgi:hypothetical protein
MIASNSSKKQLYPQSSRKFDDWQSPPEAINGLVPFLRRRFNGEPIIWECASGEGLLADSLNKEGFNVISTDIHRGEDFLKTLPNRDFDLIVTNPPYSLKDQFLSRAYQIGKPFAFLLPLTTLEGKTRQRLFARYGIELVIPQKRINFLMPDGKGSSSWFMSAWFTWKIVDSVLNFVGQEGTRHLLEIWEMS